MPNTPTQALKTKIQTSPNLRLDALSISLPQPMADASAPYRGIYPIAPVVFHDSGDLDLDGNRRVLECIIDQGVDGICILANYSDKRTAARSDPTDRHEFPRRSP